MGRNSIQVLKLVGFLLVSILACGIVFSAALDPRPKYFVASHAPYIPSQSVQDSSSWGTIEDLSDDPVVTVAAWSGKWNNCKADSRSFDMRTRQALPSEQRDEEEQELLTFPGGDQLARNAVLWNSLRTRFENWRPLARRDLPQTDQSTRLFPKGFVLSPDLRFFAYLMKSGQPLYDQPRASADSLAIDEIEAGERVCELPGVSEKVFIAPGGRVAVSLIANVEQKEEAGRLILWGLTTGRRRSELALPQYLDPQFEFSANGDNFIARFRTPSGIYRQVRWWETSSGKPRGFISDSFETVLVNAASTVVNHPMDFRNLGVVDSRSFVFWDLATGERTFEAKWGTELPENVPIHQLTASEGNPYLAAVIDPNYGRTPPGERAINWILIERDTRKSGVPLSQVLVADALQRRVVARLPGRSVKFSRDGKWVATIDEQGIVRAWQLPFRAPWRHVVLYTELVCFAWFTTVFVGTLIRSHRGKIVAIG